MPRRGALSRRSGTEWVVRGLLGLITMVAGYISLTHSLGAATKRRPALAHALAPADGQVTALRSQQYLKLGLKRAELANAERLARLALRQDGTAIKALTTLGFVKQLRGDGVEARRLFLHAQGLSRRDLATQLWAIEDAVLRNDIVGAIKHYDIALRTSRAAPDTLFPVLTNASSDPTVRRALGATLSAGPPWGQLFVEFAAKNAPDARATALLLRSLKDTKLQVPDGAQAMLVQRLLTAEFAEEAWTLYASFRAGADRRSSRDPRFTANLIAPTSFDWTLSSDAAISTSIQRAGDGGVFNFTAPPSIGGTLLQQVQILPPGTYELKGRSRGIDRPDGATPYWVLTCRDGLEIGRLVLPPSREMSGSFMGRFRVLAGCPVQTLALVARSSSSMTGLSGQIEQVILRPIES